jgi:methionyl-tRNA formyltransferase|tara:strand:- start:1541 stop:2461 length:921 start_codon:yes stop_codon:yes gene_type:complete
MTLNVVFMGTPKFSVPALEILIKEKFNILKVYTQPPKKSKRGQKINSSPIENFCKKNEINFSNPKNLDNEKEFNTFQKLSPDIVIVVAYGQIIPKKFLTKTKFGFINIHGSLLPKWRGAAPIQRAMMNGDKKIGISIMKIEEKLDSGPVLMSKELELDQNKTYGEIEEQLSIEGANLLIESLKIIKAGNSKFINQNHSLATYAKKIEKSETKINWSLNANKVLGHIHSLSPNPGAWFQYKNERFKVLRVRISSKNGKAGSVIDENLTIGCDSDSIQILELQRQGKNKQNAKDFLLGSKINKGTILI